MTAPIRWGLLPWVVLGGALGAGLRGLIALPLAGTSAVIATAAINILGAFALGMLVGRIADRRPRLRAFAGTGVLGGFTTYSAFAVQLGEALRSGDLLPGLLLAVIVTALSAAAALAGLILGERRTS